MKVKSRNMLRVPGWFNQVKKAVRSRITHKIYQSFAPVLISIKMSNTRIIDSKIELPFNQFAIWLMREQIVTEPIWRPSHPSRVRGLKYGDSDGKGSEDRGRTLHGCVDWNSTHDEALTFLLKSHPSRVRGLKYRYISTKLISFIKEIKDGWNIWSWKSYCRFKSSNPIRHSVPHRQPGRCGLFGAE